MEKVENKDFELTLFLKEILDAELVQGYVEVDGLHCWHVWVEYKGEILDPMLESAKLACTPLYSRTLPDADVDQNQDYVDKYESYSRNPVQFWEACDEKFKKFKKSQYYKLKKDLLSSP